MKQNLSLYYNKFEDILFKLAHHRQSRIFESLKKCVTQEKKILTKLQKKEIKMVFHGCPNVGFSSLSFYLEKTGKFDKFIIPEGLWYGYIDTFYNPVRIGKVLDSKALYSRVLWGGVIPVFENIACRVNGYWTTDNSTPLTLDQVLNKINKSERVFVKDSEESCGGHGVHSFQIPKDLDLLKKYLMSKSNNIVIQEGIKQHESVGKIHPNSVNTIRLITHLTKNGDVKMRSGILRMGRNNSFVDNASSGGITVGIREDGRLKPIGYDVQGVKYDRHPDTKIHFDDIIIPNYEKIIDGIRKMHWLLPQFRLLSWDVALKEDGSPVIIEVNMNRGQLDFHQLNNGPIFGEDTEEVLDEVFGRK